uniref:Carbonic anhydrase/acetyltransferase isoleucine patch superfamily-like protein n=1 Tax=uncultured Flavobacteriia bacterium TaxID=212695 RepID=H6RFX6_9BACT|nr:acetyltransferase [uncultured bacterium]CCF99937.1 carbonic anhydrase/acetyltransferase isoleucine patch superfamily-like protein [uncultured Flavobacteriia bacterium]
MALVKALRGSEPKLGADCYLAENATIIGDVVCGDGCSFWFNSVVRGDVNSIRIGNKVNVQDGAIIHCTCEKAATDIGDSVSIGHNAIVHGCTLEDHVLVGMGAIVMDGVRVGSKSLIAAGSVVLENTQIESGSLWAGVPTRKVRDLSPDLLEGEVERIANNYSMYSSWYKE